MTSEITRTEIGPLVFERGNGRFAAVFPNGEAKDYDISQVRQEIQGTLALLEELREGITEIERGPSQQVGLVDEFIEFNDQARDELQDNIMEAIFALLNNKLHPSSARDEMYDDLADVISREVWGFGE